MTKTIPDLLLTVFLTNVKKLTLLLLALFIYGQLSAQTVIQIGTGTTAPSVGTNPGSGANGASPYGICVGSGNMGKKLQIIYTAAQINAAMTAAGYAPGTSFISTVAWDISSNIGGSNYTHAGYTIKMANVTQADFPTTASAYTGAMTTVWGPTGQQYGASGTGYLVTHTLGTPFQWDGTSNLLVEVCYTITGVFSASTYGACRRTATTGNQMIYNGSASVSCATTTYATVVAAIPNMRVTVTSATPCAGSPAPGTPSANPASVCAGTTSAPAGSILSLPSLPGAAGYSYQWMVSGTSGSGYANASGTSTSSTYTTPTTLPFSPAYYVCVVTCANGGASTTSGEITVNYNSFLNCYCNGTNTAAIFAAAATTARGITNVNLVGNTTTINQNSSPNTTAPYYTLYSAAGPADLTVNASYSLKVTVGTQASNNYGTAWIDYDQNGSFDATERIGSFGPVNASTQNTINFTVPAAALSGTTGLRVLYRYNASASAVAACGPITGAATTGGAGEIEDYRVVISAGCVAPAVQASGVNFTNVLTTSNDVNWTRGDGDAGVIVVARLSTSVNTLPLNGTSYTADAVFGSGTQIGTGNYVVYNGPGTTVNVSNLLPSTNYVYSVYEYNSAGLCYGTPVTANQTTASCSPGTQPTNLAVPCVSYTTMSLSFNRGNGTHTIVLARAGSAVNADPAYNTSYTASTVFGSGSQIGTGNYVVYNGNNPGTVSVPLTGLTPGVTYHFKAYEYNSSPDCYNLVGAPAISKATRNEGTYTSSTTTQNTSTVAQGSLAQDIVKLTIVAGGGVDQAAVLNSITFSTTGSTNAANDITNAKIFYTGGTNTFSNATQFGSTFTSFAGSLTANGNFALLAGNNYFWIAYDVKMAATVGNVLDATITSINITDNNGTTSQTPSVTAPAGSRTITPAVLPYCAGQPGTTSSRASCGFGENITSVSFGSGNIVAGYSCNSAIGYDNLTATNSVTLNPGQSYTATIVADIWFSVEYTWAMWFDWNQDGDFADAGERYPTTGNILNYGSASQTIAVPAGATPGATRMRLWHQEFSHPAPSTTPCRTSNGPFTTSIGQVMDITVNIPGTPPTGNEPVSCATDAPVVTTPVNYAFNATPSQLSATGTSLLWYTAPSGGTGSATAPTPVTNASGTTTYYVSQTNTSGSPVCEGPRTQIAVRVDAQTCGTPPQITSCPGNVAVNNDAGTCGAVVTYAPAVATGDPTPTITYSQNSGTVFPVGTTTVTVTAANGVLPDASCTFDVVVTDNEDPVPAVASLPDITAECSATVTAPTATDNCAATITATTTDPTSYSSQGSFVIQWSYDDGNGNIVTQNQNVIIDDITNPSITNCPTDITSCNPVVTWTAPGATDNCGSATLSSNYNSGATFPAGTTTVTYTADDGNGNTSTCSFDVTINSASTAPTSATSDAAFNSICSGSSTVLTVNGGSLGSGADWQWYSGSCGGTSAGSGTTISVSPTTNTTYFVRAEGACGNTPCVQVSITVKTAPPALSVIVPPINNLPAYACNGTFTANINVPAVSSATHYIWDGPAGTTFNGGQNPYMSATPTADITFGNPGGSGYYIGVQAANACGTTLRKTQWVRGLVSGPGTITPANGRTTECANTSANYSIPAVTAATSYLWTITGDATISGTGTSVTVNFGPSWNGGSLCVSSQTPCYTSPPRCIALSSSISSVTLPPLSGVSAVCPGTSQSYSAVAVSGANPNGYVWSLPSNTSGASTSNSITVSFNAGFTGGNICVAATSICGVVSAPRCKSVSTGLPSTPASITGSTNGICGQAYTYSCPPQAGVTFNWTSSTGTVQSGQGTNAVSISFGTFTTGTISVSAVNSCGASPLRTITVKGPPNPPSSITAEPVVWCPFESVQFTGGISNISGTFNLAWSWLPAGSATYVLGQNTGTLFVDWNTGNATVSLTASNACGSGTKTYSAVPLSCRVAGQQPGEIRTSLNVFPNPSTGLLDVEFESLTSEKATITIMDITGRAVSSQEINAVEGVNKTRLDMNGFAKGIYTLVMKTNEKVNTVKVTLQ